MDDTALGLLLQRERRAAGLTQEELAERAGISARTVSDIERGLRGSVYRDTAARIAAALGLAAEERAEFEAVARGHRPSSAPSGRFDAAGRPVAAPPVPSTRLIGREREVASILTRLSDPRVRLLTLTGPGGIGKTRLAVEVALAARPNFSGGVCFVSLAETHDSGLVASLVARALGVNPAQEPVADLIKAALGQHRILLLLDTFEHVLDAAPVVADLLEGCPGLTVLATSRAALRLRAEHEHAVPALGLAPEGSAVELFAERALAVRPDLELHSPAAGAVVAEICCRLDGLPLAIELAASRVRHLPLVALREHLDDRLGLLTGGPRDLPLRQQAMRDTIAWSYDLLDGDGQSLLRRLSVFAGWTLESAGALYGPGDRPEDLLAGLSTLVDHSLVVLPDGQAGAPRYTMPDVVREYATQQRDAGGEAGELDRRHADHFIALAEKAEPELRRSEQLAWHRRLDEELPNLRLAFRWSVRCRDPERALRLAGSMWMFWLWSGGFAEGRDWLCVALSLAPGRHAAAEAKAVWGAGWIAFHQGDYRETARSADVLLDLAGHSGDPMEERNGLTLRGMAQMAAGNFRDAIEPFDRGLAICRQHAQGWLLATSALNLGTASMYAGDIEQAETLFVEARAVYQDVGDEAYDARAVRHLATCRLLRDDRRGAAELLRACLRSPEAGGEWGIAESLEALSLVSAAAGDARLAATLAGAAGTLRGRLGTSPHPFDQTLADRYLKAARADEKRWRRGWDEGSEMSLSDVMELAISSDPA